VSESREYLEPYLEAARRHGAGFGALLWATPATQAARFDAICRMVDLSGRSVLDVGCGRADFFDHLNARRIKVARYVGLEAVPALVDAARAKTRANYEIIEADFLAEPQRLCMGAQLIVMSGSLNTLGATEFYSTLRRAYEAAAETLVLNFLCSTKLAGASYLRWRPVDEVVRFAETLSRRILRLEDYLPGDCTLAIEKTI
jgi:SAM-dependent methyltransferase